jgi:hypothetical protein
MLVVCMSVRSHGPYSRPKIAGTKGGAVSENRKDRNARLGVAVVTGASGEAMGTRALPIRIDVADPDAVEDAAAAAAGGVALSLWVCRR